MDLRRPGGLEYLAAVTDLLHGVRCSGGLNAGLWEAADAQWWYPRDTHEQGEAAAFWYAGGRPVSAVVFTRWNAELCGADVLGDWAVDEVWEEVVSGLAAMPDVDVDLAVAADDEELMTRAVSHGFVERTSEFGIGRAEPVDLPAPTALPPGFRVVARPDLPGPHPLSARNGVEVERHLQECSLYDPSCDLAVVTDAEDIAGYALFWPDSITGVGLVEPVRIEDAYAGQGLGTALVQAGLQLLAERQCHQLKVAYGLDNPARERLYTRAGFKQQGTAINLRRPKQIERPAGC